MRPVKRSSAPSTPTSATDGPGFPRSVSATPPSHYDVLGVSDQATAVQIRQAYRTLARRYHPDRRGGAPSPEMAAINAAWHVLSDPARRAVYDAQRSPASVSRSAGAPMPTVDLSPTSLAPARFPWRLVLGLAAVGSVGVVVLSLFGQTSGPPPVDNLLTAGSCVVVEVGEVAREVSCAGAHDAVVRTLVPFDARCPSDARTLRDRQGMGWACVDDVEGA